MPLDDEIKLLPFNIAMADLEFVVSRRFQEIERVFRIPSHMICEQLRGLPAIRVTADAKGS